MNVLCISTGTIVSDTVWGREMELVLIVTIIVRSDFIPHILANWNDTRYFLTAIKSSRFGVDNARCDNQTPAIST